MRSIVVVIHTLSFGGAEPISGGSAAPLMVSLGLRKFFEVALLKPNFRDAPETQGVDFFSGSVTGVEAEEEVGVDLNQGWVLFRILFVNGKGSAMLGVVVGVDCSGEEDR